MTSITPVPIVEFNQHDRYYVLKGPQGARAVHLLYDGLSVVIEDTTKSRSIEAAKEILRRYKFDVYHSKGIQLPWNSHATIKPVFPHLMPRQDTPIYNIREQRIELAYLSVAPADDPSSHESRVRALSEALDLLEMLRVKPSTQLTSTQQVN